MSWKPAEYLEPIRCISFCQVCKLRKHDQHEGWICSLTNLPGDFEASCSSFELDIDRKMELSRSDVASIHQLIPQFFDPTVIQSSASVSWSKLVQESDQKPLKLFANEMATEYSGWKSILGLLLLAVGTSGLGYTFFFGFSFDSFLVFSILFGLGSLLVYLFNPFKKVIVLNTEGVRFRNSQLLPWWAIRYAYFRHNSGGFQKTDLIFLLQDGSSCKIPFSAIGSDPTGLGLLVHSFMAHFKKN